MILVENKYKIGQTVYLITDCEQHPRLVTAFLVRKYDIMYELSCGAFASNHMDFEIKKEKEYGGI